ncbi:MAG: hypothetical protein RLZZ242_1001 [Bacteroidota bacterium]|jgi:bacillithiol biosynthesis deacetylase BshB1
MENKIQKLDLLVMGAHPDDAELGAGATIAKEVSLGKRVGILDFTRGELGTRGTVQTRDQESAKAAKILGVSVRENMNFKDGFFVNDEAHQRALIQKIRTYQPEVVICNAISDRHIDHAKGSKLASDSCFLSGLAKIETYDLSGRLQQAWRPSRVYHMIQWQDIEPDFVVDVSAFMEQKFESILAYATQFFDPNSSEPETPISTENFLSSVRYRAQNLGRLTGVAFGEGFTVERYPLVDSLDALK